MPKLTLSERRALPPSAFAYIDSHGERRLPIHDEKHVRNALARFGRVDFETDAARDHARTKLLNAAKRRGIMPLGFITSEIGARPAAPPKLPSGAVTFLLTDVEASTELVERLGERYGALIESVRDVHRIAVRSARGHEVDARADEYFAVFDAAGAALDAALAIQRALADRTWPDGLRVRVRMGIHSGRPSLASVGYVGVDVHVAARVSAAAHGGQILVSGDARAAIEAVGASTLVFGELGTFRLRGLRLPQTLFEVHLSDPPEAFPVPRGALALGLVVPRSALGAPSGKLDTL